MNQAAPMRCQVERRAADLLRNVGNAGEASSGHDLASRGSVMYRQIHQSAGAYAYLARVLNRFLRDFAGFPFVAR